MQKKDSGFSRREVMRIPGWFTLQDLECFVVLLTYQSSARIKGNLLEIGTFVGKSASVLGKFIYREEKLFVCDLFNGVTNRKNSIENLNSYKELTRELFEKNFFKLNGYLPQILDCSSIELDSKLPNDIFRFVHIDGSHLYEFVRNDLNFALRHLTSTGGIIVVDDFRAQHTIGVSRCVWESILNGELTPLVISAAKIYLIRPGDPTYDLKELSLFFKRVGIEIEFLDIFENQCLRLIGQSDEFLYSGHRFLVGFLPPYLFRILTRLKAALKAHLNVRR